MATERATSHANRFSGCQRCWPPIRGTQLPRPLGQLYVPGARPNWAGHRHPYQSPLQQQVPLVSCPHSQRLLKESLLQDGVRRRPVGMGPCHRSKDRTTWGLCGSFLIQAFFLPLWELLDTSASLPYSCLNTTSLLCRREASTLSPAGSLTAYSCRHDACFLQGCEWNPGPPTCQRALD